MLGWVWLDPSSVSQWMRWKTWWTPTSLALWGWWRKSYQIWRGERMDTLSLLAVWWEFKVGMFHSVYYENSGTVLKDVHSLFSCRNSVQWHLCSIQICSGRLLWESSYPSTEISAQVRCSRVPVDLYRTLFSAQSGICLCDLKSFS